MKCRKVKGFSLFLCCVMICLCFAGCGATSGNKSIKINQLTSQMTLSHVNFYDFWNNKLVSDYSGTSYVPGNALTSTEIIFLDATNETRTVCVSTALSNKPATVDVYTNSTKTQYDTYTCTY